MLQAEQEEREERRRLQELREQEKRKEEEKERLQEQRQVWWLTPACSCGHACDCECSEMHRRACRHISTLSQAVHVLSNAPLSAQEEELRRAKEEQERKEEEEYLRLKESFVIEEQGMTEQLSEQEVRKASERQKNVYHTFFFVLI